MTRTKKIADLSDDDLIKAYRVAYRDHMYHECADVGYDYDESMKYKTIMFECEDELVERGIENYRGLA
jgi:hypothetical protein